MAYDRVQFVGYDINTGPGGPFGGARTYLGITPTSVDIDKRVYLFNRALNEAHRCVRQANTTLKVFVAPEFFFRGPNGAYSMDDLQTVIAKLQDNLKAAKWTDWMVVYGTILATSAPHDNPGLRERLRRYMDEEERFQLDANAVKEVYNLSLVQLGGYGNDQGVRSDRARMVMKELKSDIDFLGARAGTGPGLQHDQVRHLGTMRGRGAPTRDVHGVTRSREVQRVNYDGSGIFDLAGIRWGLETCLDHLSREQAPVRGGRLRSSPLARGERKVQFHLVPSGGMDIKPRSVVAMQNGYVFNVDGAGSHADLRRVAAEAAGIGLATVHPVVPQRRVSVPDAGLRVDELFPAGAGDVVVFDHVPVPAEQRVA